MVFWNEQKLGKVICKEHSNEDNFTDFINSIEKLDTIYEGHRWCFARKKQELRCSFLRILHSPYLAY